jgi:soluble lytic murein transglycosylase-like protein
MGLMQLMPETARRFGVRDAYDVEDNLRAGTAYLRWLLDTFSGDVQLALAAYNAGENAVVRAGHRIPDIAETRAYVPKVLSYWAHYRAQ